MVDTALAPSVRVRGLAGRGMPRRLGPLLGPFAHRFLDHIPFPAEMAQRLKALHADGAVLVYVHRARNPVEHLALARVVAREGLPAARFVGGLRVLGLQPFWSMPAWFSLGPQKPAREEALLERCVRAGLPAEIFLRKPLTLLTTKTSTRARFVEVLVRAQRTMQRPIVLVPCFLALKQRPGHFEPTPIDAIFGSVEEPGLLRALGRVLVAGDAARFEVSEPVDLRRVLAEQSAGAQPDERDPAAPPRDDAVIAKKVRWSILHHLARVERVAHGPAMKSQARMRDEILRDGSLAKQLDDIASTTGVPRAVLERKARRIHDEIAARFDVDMTRLFSRILDLIWSRIYDGVYFADDEIARLREAARRGPLVLVPSHRSHIDYLVMSQVMLKSGLLPPMVAAGDNLSFFPLGPIFRMGGAYFLRRSFKGDPLYGAVFRAYVRKLFVEGFSQEFFIEGGRSRTGKTLPPKLGLLSMLVDAYLESKEEDAIFLPCHISYERVVESGSYVKELAGKAKQKESAGALVRTAGVLRERYGRVYVTFDEPLSLKEHLAQRHLARDAITDEQRRTAVATLGHKIVYGINRAGVVTSTSLVVASLFGFRKKGLDEEVLLAGAHNLVQHLEKKPKGSVRFSPDETMDDATLRAALARLVNDKLLVRALAGDRVLYQMAPEATFPLDTFKNQLLHHVVPEAIVATAFRAAGGKPGVPVTRAALADTARALSRALKIEFIFRPGVTFDELFVDAVKNAIHAGFIHESYGGLTVPDREDARGARRFAASLIANFVEAYHACLVALPRFTGPSPTAAKDDKVLVLALLEVLKAHALAGELKCAEAPSKAIVENVVALVKDLGIVKDGALVEAKRALLDETTALLGRARP